VTTLQLSLAALALTAAIALQLRGAVVFTEETKDSP
jgi:hypothetical protein